MPIKHDPIDWPRVIADLVQRGFTVASIAASIAVPPTTVGGWRNVDAEPRHENGECLVHLWCNATRLDRSEIPTKSKPRKPAGIRRVTWIQLSLIGNSEVYQSGQNCNYDS
jgi:hypothetical protein